MPEEKICERCLRPFECRADDIKNCDCSTVSISGKEIDLIMEQYKGCLCINCLKEITLQPDHLDE